MEIRYSSSRDFFELAKERAEHFLQACGDQDLYTQFTQRRVTSIQRRPFLPVHAYLSIPQFSNSFEFMLCDTDSIEDQLMSVGHELGHTFELYDGVSFLKPPYWKPWHMQKDEIDSEIESFCEYFAAKWLACGHVKGELAALLQNENVWNLNHSSLKPIPDPVLITFLRASYSQLRFHFS